MFFSSDKPNRLLLRQVKKSFTDGSFDIERFNSFVALVNDAYNSFDEERLLYQRAEKISSKELEGVNNELQKKNDFLDTFNHGMAHDIKNHTANIIGLVAMLKKYTEKNNIEMIGQINDQLEVSAHQLTSIVQGFLYLSRGESNIDNNFTMIDSNELMELIKIETNYLMRGKKISINYKFNIKELFFSQHILKIIFVNLISNSIKYSKQNQDCVIDVELLNSNNYLELSVSDNGIGIDLKNSAKKLYNLFGQVDSTGEKGFGVGLYLIKKIVDRNNGKISLESDLGKGTTVKIEFNLTEKRD
jgi:signal transduction histidine kinase